METSKYTYLIGFTSKQFVPIGLGSRIGKMEEFTHSEVVDLSFQIHTKDDLIKAGEFMKSVGLNVERIVSFSPLDR